MITRQNCSLAYLFGLGFLIFGVGVVVGLMVGERKIFGEIIEDPKERHRNGFNLEENKHLMKPNSRSRGLMWLQ